MTPTKKPEKKTKDLYIQVGENRYPVKGLVTRSAIEEVVTQLHLGKIDVFQDGKPILPKNLKSNIPVQIVVKDKAGL